MHPNDSYGFTLVELLVTIAILAILTSLAAPSFIRIIADNQTSGHASTFVSDVSFARSEALKRGLNVSLCPSTNVELDKPSCSGSNWKTGWIVFIDTDADASRDITSSSTETVLRRREALTGSPSAQVLSGSSPLTGIRINAQGRIPGGAGNLDFESDISGLNKLACITMAGRVRIIKGGTACS